MVNGCWMGFGLLPRGGQGPWFALVLLHAGDAAAGAPRARGDGLARGLDALVVDPGVLRCCARGCLRSPPAMCDRPLVSAAGPGRGLRWTPRQRRRMRRLAPEPLAIRQTGSNAWHGCVSCPVINCFLKRWQCNHCLRKIFNSSLFFGHLSAVPLASPPCGASPEGSAAWMGAGDRPRRGAAAHRAAPCSEGPEAGAAVRGGRRIRRLRGDPGVRRRGPGRSGVCWFLYKNKRQICDCFAHGIPTGRRIFGHCIYSPMALLPPGDGALAVAGDRQRAVLEASARVAFRSRWLSRWTGLTQ